MTHRKRAATKEVKDKFLLTIEYKANVASQSYLGKQGYTIPKTALAKEDMDFIVFFKK